MKPTRQKPLRGKALLLAALKQIKQHPETWDQRHGCGSPCCICGWIRKLANGPLDMSGFASSMKFAGLTFQETDDLFNPCNTLADLERIVRRICRRMDRKGADV